MKINKCWSCGSKPSYLYKPESDFPHILKSNCSEKLTCFGSYETRQKSEREVVIDWNWYQELMAAQYEIIRVTEIWVPKNPIEIRELI
jgi:hypothetical protein